MRLRPSYRPNFRELLEPELLIYVVITLIIVSILFFFFTNKINNFRKKYRKKFLIYLFTLMLITILLPFLGTTNLINEMFAEFIFYQVLFLIAGGFHVYFFRNYFNRFELETKGPWQEMLFSFIITVYLSIPLLISYSFLNGVGFAFIMLASLIPFMVPTFYLATYIASVSIPTKFFKTWEFPAPGTYPEPTDEDYRDMVVLTFSATKSADTAKISEFRAKSPLRMDFDKLFYHFVHDYNDRNPDSPIYTNDEFGRRQHWVFYLKPSWYSATKYLDPSLPLYMNGIEENSVIYCVRTVPQDQPDEEGWVAPSERKNLMAENAAESKIGNK